MTNWFGAALLAATAVVGACAIGGSARAVAADRQKEQSAPATDISARQYDRHTQSYHRYGYRPYYPYRYGHPYYYSPGPFFPFPWFAPAPLVWW
jgi:hypothetical protein